MMAGSGQGSIEFRNVDRCLQCKVNRSRSRIHFHEMKTNQLNCQFVADDTNFRIQKNEKHFQPHCIWIWINQKKFTIQIIELLTMIAIIQETKVTAAKNRFLIHFAWTYSLCIWNDLIKNYYENDPNQIAQVNWSGNSMRWATISDFNLLCSGNETEIFPFESEERAINWNYMNRTDSSKIRVKWSNEKCISRKWIIIIMPHWQPWNMESKNIMHHWTKDAENGEFQKSLTES